MTENLYLIKPSLDYSEELMNYKQEFNKTINGIEGTSMLTSFNNIEDWLKNLKLYESKKTLPNKKYVPGLQFILVRQNDNKIVGMSNLRTELNTYLLNYGGHIGYSIRPSERKQGYGKIILKETLMKAKNIKIERVLVTCNEDNLGSEKIILSNNGIFKNKVFDIDNNIWVKRYWIDNN